MLEVVARIGADEPDVAPCPTTGLSPYEQEQVFAAGCAVMAFSQLLGRRSDHGLTLVKLDSGQYAIGSFGFRSREDIEATEGETA